MQNDGECIVRLLDDMEPKRAEIIKLRYGLNGSPRMTLKQIALQLRLTKERIRQIEKETLKMLKNCLQEKQILF